MAPLLDRDSQIISVLRQTRRIAVLGAHPDPTRPAHYVPEYLHSVGYTVLPVNPFYAGQVLWGAPVVATLAEVAPPIDLVDVFRRIQSLPDHLPELLALRPLPRVVWFQLGLRHDSVALALSQAGIDVVQDRCTLAEHRRLTRAGLLGGQTP
jgi:predicted CoA-binding protein